MSPRSAEFFEAAKRRLALARGAINHDPGGAVSGAYYSMFYAARAALSERDVHAKTHAGTWNVFQKEFVQRGEFDAALLAAARRVQREREDADYEAWAAPRNEAERVIELADTFLTAVAALLSGSDEG